MNGLLTFCRFPEPTSKRSPLVTSPVHFKVCSRVLATATMTTRVSSRCCFDCCCFLFVCFLCSSLSSTVCHVCLFCSHDYAGIRGPQPSTTKLTTFSLNPFILSNKNMAKGTTDPWVEFISQVLTQILIKF